MEDSCSSVRSSEIHYNDPKDQRCAPDKEFKNGSCFTLNGLIKMAESYNKKNNNKIVLKNGYEMVNPTKYKKYLLREFKKNIRKCDSQRCWLKQTFTEYLNEEDFDIVAKNTFRPEGPKGKFEWLNTIHIDETMKQYENLYTDFLFLGAVPMDFDDLPLLGIKDLKFDELVKNGKTKLGIIFNLDEHYKSGSHWVGMFVDLKKGEIRYFDSYGIIADKRVRKLVRRISDYLKKQNIEPIVGYNKVRHQYEGSECGVYSINFILRMLAGDDFDDICNNKVADKEVNQCRKVYFTNPNF